MTIGVILKVHFIQVLIQLLDVYCGLAMLPIFATRENVHW